MPLELTITPHQQDLGSFSVRRLLPQVRRRHVGPFVFLDHMGPADFAPGQGLDVRPHPHIGLATVTYLFEGEILHRDSLGTVQRIAPGDVNWMSAGNGIVHSERSPDDLRAQGSRLHGLQMWVALPLALEDSAPSFQHHPHATLPRFVRDDARICLIAGTLYGAQSPVAAGFALFYAEAQLSAGGRLVVPAEHAERGLYVVDGQISVEGEALAAGQLGVLRPGGEPRLQAQADSRVMLLGGPPLEGERLLWWNFVGSTPERIQAAQQRWLDQRFAPVPGETEFIPLPDSWRQLPLRRPQP